MQIFVKTLTSKTPVFGRVAASPTSFLLEEPASASPRQVSASHDKSLPLARARAQTHDSGIATDMHGGANLHVTRE
jgi:hypothetical protein